MMPRGGRKKTNWRKSSEIRKCIAAILKKKRGGGCERGTRNYVKVSRFGVVIFTPCHFVKVSHYFVKVSHYFVKVSRFS